MAIPEGSEAAKAQNEGAADALQPESPGEVVVMEEDQHSEDEERGIEPNELLSKPKAEQVLQELKKIKLEGINAVSEFESRRRGYFAPQITSNHTHWHSFLATLGRSQTDNEKVLEFFSRRLAVETKYAEALAELPNAELGKNLGPWRRASSAEKMAAATGAAATKQGSSRASLPAMDELVTSTESLSTKVQQFVDTIKKEIVEDKLKVLVTVFRTECDEVQSEGAHALENVTKAEHAVQYAYQNYAKAVEPLSAPSPSGAGGAEAISTTDLWLADMNYRVAVQLQKSIWNECQEKLATLFSKMRQLELGRRQTLHTLVLRFIQAQGELWSQFPHIATGTALRISELKMDPHEVEGELSEEIRTGAKAIEQHKQARDRKSSTVHTSPPASPSGRRLDVRTPPAPSTDPFNDALGSPLDLPLVKRVEVLDRRVTVGVESMPLMKKWRRCLAVLTIDNSLHIFDLPQDAGSSAADISTEDAFKALMPRPIDAKGRFKKGHAERISPTASLSIDFSKARHRAEDGSEAFEIVESIENSGFVKVFKSHDVKRVVLKASSQDRMVDWVVVVNGPSPTQP